MKKWILSVLALFLVLVLFCMTACSRSKNNSTFSIEFMDVGQGDAALVECDGQYMLIDGGSKGAGETVYSVLEEKEIQHLNILAISHMHEDHIGGLPKALTYASKIDKTIANADYDSDDKESFRALERALTADGTSITVPHTGDTFPLGSAKVEVVDVASTDVNDSLVLMITYGKTRFLFTGDIEDDAQTRISDKYSNSKDKAYKVDVLKMPHHGSGSKKSYDGTGSLYHFLRTFTPNYAIISVGTGNTYGHPDKETLDLLKQAKIKVYRTDQKGTIIVKSNGKTVSVTGSK